MGVFLFSRNFDRPPGLERTKHGPRGRGTSLGLSKSGARRVGEQQSVHGAIDRTEEQEQEQEQEHVDLCEHRAPAQPSRGPASSKLKTRIVSSCSDASVTSDLVEYRESKADERGHGHASACSDRCMFLQQIGGVADGGCR